MSLARDGDIFRPGMRCLVQGSCLGVVPGTLIPHGLVPPSSCLCLGPPQDWMWRFGASLGSAVALWGGQSPEGSTGAPGSFPGQGVEQQPCNSSVASQCHLGGAPEERWPLSQPSPAQLGNTSVKGRIGQSWQTGSGRNCKQPDDNPHGVFRESPNPEIPKELLGNEGSPSPAQLL